MQVFLDFGPRSVLSGGVLGFWFLRCVQAFFGRRPVWGLGRVGRVAGLAWFSRIVRIWWLSPGLCCVATIFAEKSNYVRLIVPARMAPSPDWHVSAGPVISWNERLPMKQTPASRRIRAATLHIPAPMLATPAGAYRRTGLPANDAGQRMGPGNPVGVHGHPRPGADRASQPGRDDRRERSAMLDLFKVGGYLPEREEPTNFAEVL
ncbi:hypothetical protein ACIRRA_42990 [Nocardia sp. NPDC101769]|uniref:hypothetical protein n=1 Tax=Nocardia sp. NPDC101769 TaxID=3364333 RepID=UPI00381AD09F